MRTSFAVMNKSDRVRRSGAAFTLIELLVVISLLVLLLAIGVPAFANLLRSSERSLANNAMGTAIRAARDIAQRSEGGDGALVFTMEPGGRLTMVPCIQVGDVLDRTSNNAVGGQQPIRRDVFVPHPLFRASQLPAGYTVRGFATADLIDGEWYGDKRTGNPYEAKSGPSGETSSDPNWLLPETGYYKGNKFATNKVDPDKADPDNGRNRQTFMLRFAGGTGEMTFSPTAAIVVLPIEADPAQTPSQRALVLPGLNDRPFVRARDASDLRAWAKLILNDAAFDATAQRRVARLSLIGDESVDTVLAKTVPWVAMTSERQLVADLAKGIVGPTAAKPGESVSVSLDRRTGTLYQAGEQPTLVGSDPAKLARVLNALVNGQMVISAGADKSPPPLVPEAQVFLVSAFQGNTLEVRQ